MFLSAKWPLRRSNAAWHLSIVTTRQWADLIVFQQFTLSNLSLGMKVAAADSVNLRVKIFVNLMRLWNRNLLKTAVAVQTNHCNFRDTHRSQLLRFQMHQLRGLVIVVSETLAYSTQDWKSCICCYLRGWSLQRQWHGHQKTSVRWCASWMLICQTEVRQTRGDGFRARRTLVSVSSCASSFDLFLLGEMGMERAWQTSQDSYGSGFAKNETPVSCKIPKHHEIWSR